MKSPRIFVHRVNDPARLKDIPGHVGLEVDIRADGKKLVLNHDPFLSGHDFDLFLEHYHHSGLILNIKEAGIEFAVIEKVKQRGIETYFLLDVEFPFFFKAMASGFRDLAVRFSEFEALDTVKNMQDFVNWVWIDTVNHLPISMENAAVLQGFKTCLVCPERWGRPEDIPKFRENLSAMEFALDAVMTNQKYMSHWL